jgi:hypothetical protein
VVADEPLANADGPRGQQLLEQAAQVRDAEAARRFFHRALAILEMRPTKMIIDAAAIYPAVLDEPIPSAARPGDTQDGAVALWDRWTC